jgi:hypothetical protein
MDLRVAADDLVTHAFGRAHRDDTVLRTTGGPAGNARLTAWTGLVLLVLFLAELVTLLDVHSLIGWHVVLGVLLIPPALVKTGSTGWRIVRYYAGNRPYRDAGPPPLLLRLLGPLVVVSTLAVLGTGLSLILISVDDARRSLLSAAGFGASPLLLHKASFLVWAVATGIHTLARLIPALRLTVVPAVRRSVPGGYQRLAVLVGAVAVGAVTAALALSLATPWHHDGPRFGPDRPHLTQPK